MEICERDDLAFSGWADDKLFLEVIGESSHFRSQKAKARAIPFGEHYFLLESCITARLSV